MTATIALNQAISPLTATITTDHPELLTLPSSLTIGRSLQQSFTIATAAVRVTTPVTISITAGTQVLSATLTVTPLKEP